MKLRLIGALVVLVCSVGGQSVTQAQPESAGEQPELTAKEYYDAGLRAYNIGDFDLAISQWKAGYKLGAVPDFLFNIAQAYRQKRDYQDAVFFFNAYLREKPGAPNTAQVTALRDEMEALAREEAQNKKLPPQQPLSPDGQPGPGDTDSSTGTGSSSETEPDVAVEPAGPTTATSDVGQGASGKTLKLAGLVGAGAGVALVATGVVFSIAASSAESDLEDAAANGDPWTDALADKESSGERNSTLGVVFVSLGAAAAVGGGVAYYLGWQQARASAVAIAPLIGRDVKGVAFAVDF